MGFNNSKVKLAPLLSVMLDKQSIPRGLRKGSVRSLEQGSVFSLKQKHEAQAAAFDAAMLEVGLKDSCCM